MSNPILSEIIRICDDAADIGRPRYYCGVHVDALRPEEPFE